jgi:hypothetical protein
VDLADCRPIHRQALCQIIYDVIPVLDAASPADPANNAAGLIRIR